MKFPYAEIEKKLGYTFQNKTLLHEAFLHSSYANVHGGADNERMEYLGDSVLQLIVTRWQYDTFPAATEGELTKLRQKLVCEEALYNAVNELDLGGYLLMAGGKANVGKKTISSLFETVLAAIYLDGGYAEAERFVLSRALLSKTQSQKNPKGALQEYLQDSGKPLPAYEVKKKGKDNAPQFFATVTALGKTAEGVGSSKKSAEQTAAASWLERYAREE